MNNLVSVIIPTYNREKTIKRAINSVLNQTYKNIELIIVDDGSSDNTEKLVKEIKDKKVKYYKLKENKGACFARNYGIKMSKGNLIAFQDSDDEWLEDKLENQINNMIKNNSDIDFCSYMIGNKTYPNLNKKYRIKKYGYLKALAFGNYMGTPLLLIKKECLDYYSFDDNLPRFQDWDLVLNLAKKYKISFTEKVLAKVYVQNDSITKSTEKIIRSIEIMKNKNYENRNILISTLYSILARSSSKKEKRKNYKISLKKYFRIKTLIKLIINY